MHKQIILLLSMPAFCLLSLLIDLNPGLRTSAISQDQVDSAEVTAALHVQQQVAANLTQNEAAEQKFEQLSEKAQADEMVPVIVKLRVAFQPEGEMLRVAERQAQRLAITQSRGQ